MSGKPSSKVAKHSAASHKKKGETPELHSGRGDGSPTESLISEGGGMSEAGTAVHPLDKVLMTGEEIEALRITEEKLRKVHSPHSTSSPTSQPSPLYKSPKRVMVRRARSPDDAHSRKKRVAVLRPLPHSVSASATRTLALGQQQGRKGAQSGLLQPTVLGSIEDYTVPQAQSEGLSPPGHTPSISQPPYGTSPTHTFSYQDTILPRETHALQYWDEAMEDRKHQQHHLSKKLHTSPERLAMSRGDGYRQVQEERMRIDRAIPPLDYGKGYRVGSEFWSQSVLIGDAETGINTTLNRSEKGQPLPLELVGVPNTVRREKGMLSAKGNALHHTWQSTPYLTARTQQLHSTLTDMQDATPDMDELDVIGHAPHHPPNDLCDHSDDPLDSLGEEASYSEDSLSSDDNSHNKLDRLPDTFSHPLVGPALTIRGHHLKWEGPPTPDVATRAEPVDLRVIFESGVAEEVTSCLAMQNSRTTAVYYSWKRLVQPNPLVTVQAGDTQRFYFDIREGVLLPSQDLSFPFVFKSPNAGIFTETWALQTGPVLARGREIRVTLRGVAFQEDTNTHKRDELESELNHRIVVAAAERLINQIVDSISTPPHPSPLLPPTTTEEDLFTTQNPRLYYHYNIVNQLKSLYDEILRPDLGEDHPDITDGHTATPTTRREKSKTAAAPAKKGMVKAGSGDKEKAAKDSAPEPAEESSTKLLSTVPDWDCSIDSLLQVVLGIEEDKAREEKLRTLCGLLGDLSFPPPTLPPLSPYTLVYQLVGEAMEQVSAASQSLCKVMGLAQRESSPLKTISSATDDDQLSSTASSAAVSSKKEKDKKGKKQDTKKGGGAGKDKERAPSRNKTVTGRKSKNSVTSKDIETQEVPVEQQQSPPEPVQVNPTLEKKYKENFHALVYGILADTVDKMMLLLPKQT